MKKNKMMRIAAVLLVVTLISTCAISGTFAKYVTKATLDDSARVAKWGIKIETSGDLFASTYPAEDEDYIAAEGEYSVEAANGEDFVVAPGTGSDQIGTADQPGGFSARVYGKPEVATRFALKLTGLKDVYMPFGTYPDYTQAVVDGQEATFDFNAPEAVSGLNNNYVTGYAPVKWDVRVTRIKNDGTPGRSISLVEEAREVAGSMGLEDLCDSIITDEGVSITDAKTIVAQVKRLGLEDQLIDGLQQQFQSLSIRNLAIEFVGEDIILSMDFDPNQNVNYLFEGKWAWAYEQTAPSFIQGATAKQAYVDLCDKCDTYLGNVAAGIIENVPEAVSTDLKFAFVASATQID